MILVLNAGSSSLKVEVFTPDLTSVFSGAVTEIGENSAPIRDRIMAHLACFGDVPVHVIAADEEKQIARDALTLMGAA